MNQEPILGNCRVGSKAATVNGEVNVLVSSAAISIYAP